MTAPQRSNEEPAAIPEAGDRIGEKYLVERILGQGAAGVVYEAVHDYTGRRVAIKWVHPHVASDATNAARFLREARAAAAVRHPNVVEILDAGRDRETFYLVMERLDGDLLSAVIAKGGLPPPAVARIFLSTLRGVAAAHALGIVHRDLKPENVFLARAENGRPGGAKVLDFGISKLKMTDGRELTAAGVFIGSPYYMAPEQIADSRSVDARADVYSLGVMLYETFAGRLPFDAESLAGLFAKIVSEEPRSLLALRPDLPAGLAELVMKAMSSEPARRFPTVRALALALEPYAEGMQFDPGGDAFELAWRERASMVGEELAWLERPSTAIDELSAEPTRRADQDEILRDEVERLSGGDAASEAISLMRERSARGDLPDQPTLIRPRSLDGAEERESTTSPSRSAPQVEERVTMPPARPPPPPGRPLIVPPTTPGQRPPTAPPVVAWTPPVAPRPVAPTRLDPSSFARAPDEVTAVVRGQKPPRRGRGVLVAVGLFLVLSIASAVAFVLFGPR